MLRVPGFPAAHPHPEIPKVLPPPEGKMQGRGNNKPLLWPQKNWKWRIHDFNDLKQQTLYSPYIMNMYGPLPGPLLTPKTETNIETLQFF